jgi:hypothetical protein
MVEVVRGGFLGGLVVCPTVGPHGELGLGRSPGGVDERGRGRFTDVGKDLGGEPRIGEEGRE